MCSQYGVFSTTDIYLGKPRDSERDATPEVEEERCDGKIKAGTATTMSPSIGESGEWERENKKRRLLLVAEYPFWARLQIDEIGFE